MDLIGKGKDAKGAVWVARRVPDGLHLGARQPGADPPVPAERPGQLPVLEGRHLVRPRQGLVHRAG